jgi:hypothetical protein
MIFGIVLWILVGTMKDEDYDLSLQYYTNPYKQRFLLGAAKCSTKPLANLSSSILTPVKTGLQGYHGTSFWRLPNVDIMQIQKISKDSLETLSSRFQYFCKSI